MEVTPTYSWSLSSLTITDCFRQPLAIECPISAGPRLRVTHEPLRRATKPLARGGDASLPSQSSAHLQVCSPGSLLSCQPSTRVLGFHLLPMGVMAGGSIWILGALLEAMSNGFLVSSQNMGNYLLSLGQGFSWNLDIRRKIPLNILLYSILASKQDQRNVNILFQFDILSTHSHPLSISY